MKRIMFWVACAAAVSCATPLQAALLQEFLFNDASGTPIQNTANSVIALQWSGDSAGDDLAGVGTNGAGQYNVSLKNNEGLGTVFLDIPDITAGTIYGVLELTWDFNPAPPIAGEEEEIIRLSLINSPTLGSSTVTAEVDVTHGTDNVVRIFGNGIGTGSADTTSAALSSTQSTTFIAVVAVNLDSDQLWVSYSADAGASFTTLKDGVLDPARFAQQVRLYLNNDFSADQTLIDRIALYDTNPYPGLIQSIPEPATVSLMILAMAGLSGRRRRA